MRLILAMAAICGLTACGGGGPRTPQELAALESFRGALNYNHAQSMAFTAALTQAQLYSISHMTPFPSTTFVYH